jgi:ATP-dependent Clp protease ATP-binding subunit ClpB
VLIFGRLGREEMARIVDIQLARVNVRLAERHLTLVADQSARRRLGDMGWDPAFGARPLKRAIQGLVEDPIAERLLDAGDEAGEPVVLTLSVIAGRLALDGEIVEDDRPQGFKAPERPPIGFALAGVAPSVVGNPAGGSTAVH